MDIIDDSNKSIENIGEGIEKGLEDEPEGANRVLKDGDNPIKTLKLTKDGKIDKRQFNKVKVKKRGLSPGRPIVNIDKTLEKAEHQINKLLPISLNDVEKTLEVERNKPHNKRDGWLILACAKFLTNKRIGDMGKIEPEDNNNSRKKLNIILNLPRPKRLEAKEKDPRIIEQEPPKTLTKLIGEMVQNPNYPEEN